MNALIQFPFVSRVSARGVARALALALSGVVATGAWAEPLPAPTQSMMTEIMSRQQQMQAELGELRDLVERQGYELEMLKRANKQAYADTDQRLSALESPASTATAGAPAQAPVSGGGSSVPAPAVPPPAPVVAAPAVATAEDQAKYDQGLKLLRAGQYAAAIKMFDQVVKINPPSPNRPNALYWTGEAHVVTGNSKAALAAFERVVKESPAHQKAADAELKIGYIYYDQKNYAQARETLNKVKAKFPGTQAAALAEQRLKRMQSEGV